MDEQIVDVYHKVVEYIPESIEATNGDDEYDKGFRNALRFCLSLLTNTEPEYE